MNEDQSGAIIGSDENLMYATSKGLDINLSKEYDIEDVRNVIFDKGNFYILANKRDGKIGYFLIKFNFDRETNKGEVDFLINWEHKLPINDADMSVMSRKDGG